MANRIFRKFYLFFILFVGVSFWALVKNVGLPEVPSVESPKSRNNVNQVISNRLNALEGEIASQKVYSSVLLHRLRDKLNSDRKLDAHDIANTGQQNSANQNGDKANNNPSDERDEKLLQLQKELAQEAHHGEVKSEGEEAQLSPSNQNRDKDGDVINNEVIDELAISEDSVIAVLVFVCNRPTVKRNLDQLFKYRPSPAKFPIVVSQDCGSHAATTAVLKSYGNQFTHIMQPDLSEIEVPAKEKKLKGYYNIARHYGFALNYTFNVLNYSNVIIVEDDLDIAPDFFEYFSATLPILKKDSSIWCVSAWNDNGKPKRINETAYDLLHRTDFFPGLGWMLTKDLWKELMVKWPRSYWDDWMREPTQRKDRVCIRPEISRTSTFGKYGVSHGTYYQNHLRFIKLNDHFVPFTHQDLSYLLKDKYDVEFVRRVYSSQLVQSVTELLRLTVDPNNKNEFRLTYRTKNDFRIFAKKLEIMEDLRAGVPRTAYRGVVPFMYNNHRIYLAPGANWESYQPK